MLVAYIRRQHTAEAVQAVNAESAAPAKKVSRASHGSRTAKRKSGSATDAAYVAAFARVRLVRAWIGAAAAAVALGYAFASLLDRVLP